MFHDGCTALDARLLQAIGRTAVESARSDEGLRELLECILGTMNSSILFEGQSSEWLIQSARVTITEFKPLRKYPHEELDRCSQYLEELGNYRSVRNSVIHGVWMLFNSDLYEIDDMPQSRPWGNSDTLEDIYVCILSRLRKRGNHRLFSVSDVETLSEKIRSTTHLLLKAFIRMNDGNESLRRGSFSRWNLDDVMNPDEAWKELY